MKIEQKMQWDNPKGPIEMASKPTAIFEVSPPHLLWNPTITIEMRKAKEEDELLHYHSVTHNETNHTW